MPSIFVKKNIVLFGVVVVSIAAIVAVMKFWPIHNDQQTVVLKKDIIGLQTAAPQENITDLPTVTSQQNIIINALPKSGSAYMQEILAKSLDYQIFHISSQYIPQDQVVYGQITEFYNMNSKISKQHLDASQLNMQILRRFTDRMVLHVRDPREVLLSWVHHLYALHEEQIDLYYFTPTPPHGYYELSLHDQIDWNIDNFLPAMVAWLNDWSVALEQQTKETSGLKILLTTYEELLTDELQLFNKILDFYEIPQERFTYTPVTKDRSIHFRKGDPKEWRQVFTEQQRIKIASVVPDDLLQRFNWEP